MHWPISVPESLPECISRRLQILSSAQIDVDLSGRIVKVVREIDGGLETLGLPVPSIVTCDLRLNTPRFAKLQDIMKARKKPIDKKTPEELGVDINPHFKILSVEEPPVRQAGVKVKSVEELVSKLKGAGVL
jgi:electron transfer flavoprotein beta subunit